MPEKDKNVCNILNKVTLTTENRPTVLCNLFFLVDMSIFDEFVIKN